MRIVSFNTGGTSHNSNKRYQIFSHYLEKYEADVIHFQEVWTYSLLNILKQALPSYSWVYKNSLIGPKAGLVSCTKLPAKQSTCHIFPSVGEPPKKKLMNRIKRSLKEKGALTFTLDSSLTFCNTYLVANGDGDWSEHGRYSVAHRHDLSQLVHFLERIGNNPLFLCGDFNVAKCSVFYQEFVALCNLQDAFQHDDTPSFHQAFLPASLKAHRIDYMFHSHHIVTHHTAHLFEAPLISNGKSYYLSDHIGLIADVKINM